ncbi:hypothetical protein [Mycobacterium celatum]|uniref:Uncharacterized protein n=1 Tax=Mycobacterium celatum TaxID=28045 RepID=A0A1X1RPK6_MYCCE|nr:hypothetical protein [Mycobacterium celatum]ORV10956.1 hypothetical protein AWB95_14190 [Mycobacterium celatum]PIB79565.1 hypothetical protein CQY23_08335 [Mycobacterium celatum]
MTVCNERFVELARLLDFTDCRDLNPMVYLNDPLHLKHPTMLVIELLFIGGAVLFLVDAVRRLRRHGDPTYLGVWCAAIVYLIAMELPIYFPEPFHLDSIYRVIFIHNEFTIGFLYHRMPLYIVALYITMLYLAYAIIDRAGIFDRRHCAVIGAVAVGFTHHVFYEIFDHFGPQYRWWLWDYDLSLSHLTLKSVPLYSMMWCLLGPFAFTLVVRLLLVRKLTRGWSPASLAGWVALSGVLTTVVLAVLNTPVLVAIAASRGAAATAVLVGLFAIIVAFGAVTVWALLTTLAITPRHRGAEFWYACVYLVTFAALWAYALPEYLAAEHGVTARGTPIGSLPYALGCYAVAAVLLALVYRRTTPANVVQPPPPSHFTSSGVLSGRSPRQLGWRSRPSDVHSL